MVRRGTILVRSVAIGLGVLLAGSFAGALHPLGDSLAVFRTPLAVLMALVAIWSDWPRALRWTVAAFCLAWLAWVAAAKLVPGPAGPLHVYQKNLGFGNARTEALVRDIRMRWPHVVTLQEVSAQNHGLLEVLAAEYPYRAVCRFSGRSGMAVLSRLPSTGAEPICSDGRGLAALQVETAEGPVWVASVHLYWPYPYDQRRQVREMVPVIESLEGPVVLAGAFNMVPWGWSLRVLARAAEARRAGPLRPTLLRLPWPVTVPVPLPIDHVLSAEGGRITTLPRLGSHHKGLWAEVFIR